MLAKLVTAMEQAIAEARRWDSREVLLLHHNDADGLSSAAILSQAFVRAGFDVQRLCLEKPYPRVLERVFQRQGQLIAFADFAGRLAPLVSQLNKGQNLVLILDHHKAEPATDPLVHNLDPELYGLRGDQEISASVTCFVFARALDPGNEDLALLAAIGAVGDRFFVDGRLTGPNREAALSAQGQGLLAIDAGKDHELYTVTSQGQSIPCTDLAADLDTLGAAGYLEGGPELGIALLLEGPSSGSVRALERWQELRDRAFAEELSRIDQGELRQTAHIQWLHVHDRFAPMGVKMIGLFLEAIKGSAQLDPTKYLAGFQDIPQEIPGMGSIPIDAVKISMRVSDSLARAIIDGQAPGLDTLLPRATTRLGGFVDACHSLAAATTVAPGLETRLIEEMEQILAGDS